MRFGPALALLSLAAPPLAAEGTGALADDGRSLFLAHCAACHGENADAGAPGDIRGLSRAAMLNALGGVEQMPSFSFLTEPEIDAILEWLGARDA